MNATQPSHGADRISFDLKKLFNILCAPMTVYNVLKRLKLISKTHQKKLTKKHHRRYRRPFPGYMQMDIKYVPYKVELFNVVSEVFQKQKNNPDTVTQFRYLGGSKDRIFFFQ